MALWQPYGHRVANSLGWGARWEPGCPQLQEHRAGTSLTTELVLHAGQQFPERWLRPLGSGRAQPPSWGWTVLQVSPMVLGQVGTYLTGTAAWEEGGEQPVAQSWWRGLSCLAVRAARGSPRVAVEQGAVGLMRTEHSGLWL